MSDNPFKQWWKNYLSFSKKDRNAIITLSGLILLVLIGHIVIEFIDFDSNLDRQKAQQVLAEWNSVKEEGTKKYTYFEFNPNTISAKKLDSLFIPEYIKRNIVSYRNAGGKYKKASDVRKIYGMTDSIFAVIEKYIKIPDEVVAEKIPSKKENKAASVELTGFFNPNVAGMDTLLKFGFNDYQAGNLIKYRNSGGSFKRTEDVLKIYGIDSTFFRSIQRHIQIEPIEKEVREKVKQPPEISVELNSANAEQLEKLSGIGPVFAERIIKFRDLLGGFYSKEQLLEVYNLPEETYYKIENNVSVDTSRIKQIRLNFADFGDLIRHPYLQEEEVKKLLNHREKNGPFKSTAALYEIKLIKPENFIRVKPYLSCR